MGPLNPVSFVKSHGLGNDFIILNRREWGRDLAPSDAVALCDRRRGLGGDGLLILQERAGRDPFMRILNADGSEPEMCGNGIRVFARYLVETHGYPGRDLKIETLAGVKTATVGALDESGARPVRVSMGAPALGEPLKEVVTTPEGSAFEGTFVSMGNPHFVVPTAPSELNREFVARYGPVLEQHDRFEAGANIEFVTYDNETGCRVIVWERGCGITDACGTGACAVVAAGITTGDLDREREHVVHLPGGALKISWPVEEGDIWMTGPTQVVAEGVLTAPS